MMVVDVANEKKAVNRTWLFADRSCFILQGSSSHLCFFRNISFSRFFSYFSFSIFIQIFLLISPLIFFSRCFYYFLFIFSIFFLLLIFFSRFFSLYFFSRFFSLFSHFTFFTTFFNFFSLDPSFFFHFIGYLIPWESLVIGVWISELVIGAMSSTLPPPLMNKYEGHRPALKPWTGANTTTNLSLSDLSLLKVSVISPW